MKVLFVSSGNANTFNNISPIVYSQGESLKNEGTAIHYFGISGKGFKSYFRAIPQLRKLIKELRPDVVHAHYSLSAIAATLSGGKPMVVSLMGSDVKEKSYFKFLLWVFYKFFWNKTIVKSKDMKSSLGFRDVFVLPNGVNTAKFYPMNKIECQDKLNWDSTRTHILFAANPSRFEKNYPLAEKACSFLQSEFVLHTLTNIDNNEIPLYMNAADVVLLTSLWEGSPNVIKEAMACARPIVTTNVGDVSFLLNQVSESYICDFDENQIASGISKAIAFSKQNSKTNGDSEIERLELNSMQVAKKLRGIYKSL